MILNYDYSTWAADVSREEIEASYLETFEEVKNGVVVGAEDNFLDVTDKHGTKFFGNLVYYREDGRIHGMFVYGDDDAGENFIVDFDYPEEEITSFQVLLEKVAAEADEEQE